MTDKTEAQPEALRLAAWLNEGAWHQMRLGDVLAAGRELRRLHAEIQQLKAKLSARQAAPDGLTQLLRSLLQESCVPDGDTYLSNEHYRKIHEFIQASPPPEREPLTDEQIFAIARDVFGGKAHELIHETSPDYAKDCDLEPSARWTCSEVRPEQTLALSRALEHAHGIGATND